MDIEIYRIKRTYYGHSDYLIAWDSEYGTACMGNPSRAMIFVLKYDAEQAAERANRECKGFHGQPKSDSITFQVEPIPPLNCVREEICAYKRGETHIDAIIVNGRTQYMNTPVEELIADGCVIMTLDKATALIDKEIEDTYNKPWEEITEEEYWDALEALPPQNWWMNCFYMSEFTISNYTAHYINIGKKYYTAVRKAGRDWTPHMDELAKQLRVKH